ncbi:major facilitator superfamily domain-containing protein, partial [Infundibulicybe gibba]
GNIVAGTSHGFVQLVTGRLISGFGGAGLLSLSTILVSQLTHERQRGSYLNFINVVFTIADAVGPVIGGALTQSGNWRWIFLLNAPFGPISAINGFRATLARLDVLGMCTLIVTLTFLVVGMN